MDTTLLLPSAIGSPAAFSTAIKPPGNFSNQPSSVDSSLLAQQPHNQLSDNVAGQLSLSLVSEPLNTEGPASDETSLGILDLDNIQESSMSVFLTSPRTSQDLHNLMTAHPQVPTHHLTSHPLPSSLSAASLLPSMDPLRLSENTAPTSSSQLVDNTAADGGVVDGGAGRGGEGEGELGLPEDLLEVSSSVGYSSTGESEPEVQSGGEQMEDQLAQISPDMEQNGEEMITSAVPTDSIPYRSAVPTDSIPDHVRQSGDGRETDITRLIGQGLPKFPPSTPHSGHHSLPSPRDERDDSEGFSVAEILSNAENKGKELKNSSLFSGTATGNSLIIDTQEPTIMREAAELSRFEPDHLASVMKRDSLLRESHVLGREKQQELNRVHQIRRLNPASTTVREGERDDGGGAASDKQHTEEEKVHVVDDEHQTSILITETTSPEGLPSAYFQPLSAQSSPSQTPTYTLSHTPSGTPNSSPPLSPSSSVPPEGDGGGEGEGEGEKQMESRGKQQHSTSYNPFDSGDAASVQEMGDAEFGGGLDSNSFMAHLEADEAAVQEANKLMLPASFTAVTPHTPSFAQLSSTSLPSSLAHSREKELSIGTYFGQRSYKLGILQASGVPPNDRPHFSASSSRLIHSPLSPPKSGSAVQSHTTPTSHVSSTPPDAADTTLVATQDESIAEEKTPRSTLGSSLVQNAHSLTTELHQSVGITSLTPALSLPTSAAKLVSPTSTSAAAKLVSQAPQLATTRTAAPSTQAQVHMAGISGPSSLATGTELTGVSRSDDEKVNVHVNASGGAQPQTTAPVTRVSVENLTPVVTVHTPFPMQYEIPKLDFSKTLDSTPHTRSSTGLKSNLPALSVEFKHHTSPHPLTQTASRPVPIVSAIGFSPELAPTTVSLVSSGSSPVRSPDMECGLQQSCMDSGLSSGIEPGLASQYWKPSSASSTLVFPELSTATLSPPPTEIDGLSSMPTPSMAHLSGGFNASSEDGSFLESLLGPLPTSSGPLSSHTSKLHDPSPSTTTVEATAPALLSTQQPHTLSPSSPLTGVKTVLTTGSSEQKETTSSHLHPACQRSSESTPVATRSPVSPVSPSLPTVATTRSFSHTAQNASPGTTKTPRKQQPLSPRTETTKKKMAELKATLDATQFDAAAYLASLEKGRPVVTQRATVVSQSQTTVTQSATMVSQSPTVVTQSTTVVSTAATQSPSVVTRSTTVVSTASTQVVSQSPPVDGQSTTLVQPVSLSFSTASTSTAAQTPGSGLFQHLSPSPPQSLPSTISQPPVVTRPTRTTGVGPPSTIGSHSLDQTDSGTQWQKKTTIKSVAEVPEIGGPRCTHQFVAMRDIGVGTTPGLRRVQGRSSSDVTEGVSIQSTIQSESPPATISPSVSPHKIVPSSQSPLSPPFSSVTASSRQGQPSSSSSQPIYTSPRLQPYTSSLSPPPQLHSQPLTYRERRKTPEPNTLKVPDSLIFKSPCCVGVTLPNHLQIANVGDRWLQLGLELSQLYCDGMPCQTADMSTFSFPKRCFVSPRKTESIKIIFSPKQTGNFEAVLTCKAKLVVSSEKDDSNCLSENVILKALSVSPKLKVSTSLTESETSLDYGVLVSGSSLSLPLLIANHGPCELPLRLAIAAPTLSQLYFSFEDMPPSLKTPPSSPSSYLHTRPFSTVLMLPPKPQGTLKKPEIYSINVNFKSPRNYSDDATPLGPPEEIKAQVNISVEGPNSTGVLCSVPITAVVGVARLHVPRSLQALSLSCAEKRSVTREVPFKNAGNIPLQIALTFSTNCGHFLVTPSSLKLTPGQEAQVKVSFSPPTSPLVIDGYLTIHVQPDGPSYELKVRGTAEPEEELQGNGAKKENLLFCNRRHLYWGGVNLRDTVEQKLLLQNSFSSAVPLQFSVRHKNQAFQLHTDSLSVCWEHSADLPASSQLQLDVLFTPVSKSVFRNALDIFDAAHSKKFRIPLCGYGGTSAVEVVNARHSSAKGLWLDLGSVSMQQQSKVNVSLYNSGVRAAFVKALCLSLDSGDDMSALPPSQACVAPSECVLQPQQMQDLTIVYQPSSSEEVEKCAETVAPLAQLVVLHGDEIIRQRFQRAMATGEEEKGEGERVEGLQEHQLRNNLNAEFLEQFPGQESVPSELDFTLFEVEDEENFFEQHLQQIAVTLSGSPMTETPIPTQSRQPLSTSFDSPPKALHTLSPSHSISQTTPTGHTHQATPSSRITSSHTLTLPDSTLGRHSEKMLEIHNPYSQPLHWQLSSVASPFVRSSVNMSSDICKANYSAFWVHERRGTVLPHSSSQVLVEFQPHDVGSFSQIWDLQVSCKEIESGSKKIRLSFGGKAIVKEQVKVSHELTPAVVPRVRFAQPPHQPPSPISHTTHPQATITTAHPHTLTKRTVYIKEEMVEFPPTQVGGQSILKVKVCNRDRSQHQFQVVSLPPPYSVVHHCFELGSRQCARLPVHFSPSQPGVYAAVLAVRTAAGHQAFSQLTGLAIASTEDTT